MPYVVVILKRDEIVEIVLLTALRGSNNDSTNKLILKNTFHDSKWEQFMYKI